MIQKINRTDNLASAKDTKVETYIRHINDSNEKYNIQWARQGATVTYGIIAIAATIAAGPIGAVAATSIVAVALGLKVSDVVAPGSDIASTYPNNKYGYASGTSCAVPFVGGLAEMIYSCSKYELSSSEIKEIICTNVSKRDELMNKI